MFEKADHDAFQIFGQYGASANAFTSFTKTSYLFSATRHLQDNLMTLLDFVQDPYFTPAIDDLTQQRVTDTEWLRQIQSVTREQIIAVAKMVTLNNGFFLSGVTA
ncbi:hypothetical protein WP50_29880 [Lactiplantibacillus plantarum]|nr:hypothetical protein WP50_29880 [Lactiplantibacillus plantarum]